MIFLYSTDVSGGRSLETYFNQIVSTHVSISLNNVVLINLNKVVLRQR